jgi:hypothetical protein
VEVDPRRWLATWEADHGVRHRHRHQTDRDRSIRVDAGPGDDDVGDFAPMWCAGSSARTGNPVFEVDESTE